MKYTWEQINALMSQRRLNDSLAIRRMIEVRDRYNGDMIYPLPDVEGEPAMQSVIPHLIVEGIDGHAMRAGSVPPMTTVPAVDPEITLSRKRADRRRRGIHAIYHRSHMEMLLYRAYRHLAGYGTCCVNVVPDFDKGEPRIQLRDPLTAYPEIRTAENYEEPVNVGFVFGRSASWIMQHYPQAKDYVANQKYWDLLWDMVEWIDEDDIVLGILGPRDYGSYSTQGQNIIRPVPFRGVELRRWPNRAGMVTCAIPRRVTMDRVVSQMHTMIPITDLFGRMMALDTIAAEKGVFGDLVIFGERGQTPTIVGNRWKDGREGDPNIVLDAKDVRILYQTPGPGTETLLNRLERAARSTGGVSPFFGGESTGSLRTGRAIDSLGGFAIDSRIQESQLIMSRALMVVNEAVLATFKGYWPKKDYHLFSGWRTDTGQVRFVPEKDFENYDNVVAYAFPGADISQVTVAVGQMVGSDIISKQTGRIVHPYSQDPEHEADRIVEERINDAMLASMLQQAQSGQLPVADLANIARLVGEGNSLIESVLMAQRQAQQRQVQQPPPPQPGQGAPPETAPGLSMPGMGIEANSGPNAEPGGAQPTIGPPPPSLGNFQLLMRELRKPPAQNVPVGAK